MAPVLHVFTTIDFDILGIATLKPAVVITTTLGRGEGGKPTIFAK
jgi:hypothetical protein